MRKATVMLVLMLGLLGFAGRSWAAGTDTITVTVSLAETASVLLDGNAWTIGAISLGLILIFLYRYSLRGRKDSP